MTPQRPLLPAEGPLWGALGVFRWVCCPFTSPIIWSILGEYLDVRLHGDWAICIQAGSGGLIPQNLQGQARHPTGNLKMLPDV